MRHFFITSFERLMNVMVVLTGLAILALAGKMAMAAHGDSEQLLYAALVLLGGFVALITFAGSAYLAIANHKTLRRMATLVETGGRAAKPLTATRSRELPARRVVQSQPAPLHDEPFEEDEAAVAPPAVAAAPVRHAPVMRAAAKAATAPVAAQLPVAKAVAKAAAKPAFSRQMPVMRAQTEAPMPDQQMPDQQMPESHVLHEPQPAAPSQSRMAAEMQAYGESDHAAPYVAAPQQAPLRSAYQPEPAYDDAPHEAQPAGVFSGRAMPKARGPAEAPAQSPVFSQPALGAQPRSGGLPHGQPSAAQPAMQAQPQPAAAQPIAQPAHQPSATAQKSGRLVADRRPAR